MSNRQSFSARDGLSPTPPVYPAGAASRMVHVVQGDATIPKDSSVVLTTVLGSCIAVCMHDPKIGIGGMNHFLLPGDPRNGGDHQKYGVHLMECLVNGLLRQGASRDSLEAKVFGGGNVLEVSTGIGAKNAAFAHQFLSDENIPVVGESTGGDQARRVRYWPATGKAKQLFIDKSHAAPAPEPVRPTVQDGGDLELF